MLDFTNSGAIVSSCDTYRYALWRRLASGSRVCMFIGLNPSTADAITNDRTINRCISFAKGWNFDFLFMLNLFAYRSTDPKRMLTSNNPVGPENDTWISKLAIQSQLIILAWGNDGGHMNRDQQVIAALSKYELMCLGKTKSGCPKHPLYVKGDVKLEKL